MLDVDPTLRILLCAVVWACVVGIVLRSLSKPGYPTTGLTFTFFGAYTSAHIGALVYLTDGYDPTLDSYLASFGHTPATVALGFEASTVAMLSALLGTKVADIWWGAGQFGPLPPRPPLAVFWNGGIVLVAAGLIGLVVDSVFSDLTSALPGFQALISSARNLFVIGGSLLVWHETVAGRQRNALILAVFFMLAVPVVVLATTAILADSIFVGLGVFSFYLSVQALRGRSVFLYNAALVASLCVAGFVFSAVYLEVRDEVRTIFGQGGSITDAAGSLSKSGQTEVRTSTDSLQKTLYAIDSRLNQNLFVGLAMQKLDALPDTYEEGGTILLAMFGWVPRFLWPGKPERGGSAMITKHTGKKTDGVTTFGAGAVFEFYVNFGYPSVIIGFLLLGAFQRTIDAMACRALVSGQVAKFGLFGLWGYAVIQPLADLFFIVAAIGSATVFMALLAQPIAYLTAVRRQPAGVRSAKP